MRTQGAAAMIMQIYEVRSPGEAAALAACGVDHIGVLVGFGAFPREMAPKDSRAIFAACAGSTIRVALSLSAAPGEIDRVIAETAPDIIHIGAAPELLLPEAARAIKARHPNVRLMRSIPVVDGGAIAIAAGYEGIADFLLLDSHDPGDPQVGALGRTHDWTISRRIVESVTVPVILAGGLGPDNVAAAIDAVRPAGVDSKTRTDRADGSAKDLDAVRAFGAAAKAAS
ncbi:MAG TPA: phosphoribosylanthranilate isomerase [Stellaceae bacterium]|nr:phosphoribosylanthranilate isomerase [Stellaceae bacterium]